MTWCFRQERTRSLVAAVDRYTGFGTATLTITARGSNSFWLGNGDGTFCPASGNLNGADISQFTARDLDLDSLHELPMTSWSNSLVLVALTASRDCKMLALTSVTRLAKLFS